MDEPLHDYDSGSTRCYGDSGGPLVCIEDGEVVLSGLNSFGYIGCPTRKPAGFSKVSNYLDWIDENMEHNYHQTSTDNPQEHDKPECIKCEKRIIDGSPIYRHVPWVVSIGEYRAQDKFYLHVMNGAILDSRTVITTKLDKLDTHHVLAGKLLVDTPTKHDDVYKIASVIQFETNFTQESSEIDWEQYGIDGTDIEWEPLPPNSGDSELAILKLDRPLKFGRHIKPVCLPSNGNFLSRVCYINGWGKVDKNNSHDVFPSSLHYARVPIFDNCPYNPGKELEPICVGVANNSYFFSRRDGGAPLVCAGDNEYVLAGIRPWFPSREVTDDIEKYIAIYPHLNWIRDNMIPECLSPKLTEATTVPATSSTTTKVDCHFAQWIGDGQCDDDNNNPECDFDGGDCCSDTEQTHCTECLCKTNGSSSVEEDLPNNCISHEWIGDGVCDDENNVPECDYDGGDCCVDTEQKHCKVCECIVT